MITVFLMREQESYKQALPATINLIQTLHLISTGIQDNIAQLIEDLETASKKIQGHLFYWFQNQCIKIQEKEGRQKESKTS